MTWTRNKALTKTASAWPSLKYSFNVVLNFFEYFTNSFLRCSTACFPDVPGMKPTTSFTASSSFLMALAISLIVNDKLKVTNVVATQELSFQLTLLSQGKFSDRLSRLEFDSRYVWVQPTSCWVLGMRLQFYLSDILSLSIFRFLFSVSKSIQEMMRKRIWRERKKREKKLKNSNEIITFATSNWVTVYTHKKLFN